MKSTRWEEIQAVVSRYYGEWNDTSYVGAVSGHLPLTAILGNGDIGVTSGGSEDSKTFYVSKSDFWEYGGDALPIGGITIGSPIQQDSVPGEFHEIQDILHAEIQTEQTLCDVPTEMKTWISSEKNIIVTELSSKGRCDARVQVKIWGYPADRQIKVWEYPESGQLRPVTLQKNKDCVLLTRQTNNKSPESERSFVSKAALATKVLGAEDVETKVDADRIEGTLNFTLRSGKTVVIVSAVGGSGRNYSYDGKLRKDAKEPVKDALDLLSAVSDFNAVKQLDAERCEWWKKYWSASYIDFGTDDKQLNLLQKYYYGAQYIFGSTVRKGKIAPGMRGVWNTSDTPVWSSGYTMNYNFISTFYGVNSSNRTEFMFPVMQALFDYLPEGRKNASSTETLKIINEEFVNQKVKKGDIDPEKGISGAILYNLGLDPWGYNTRDPKVMFLNEAMCATYNSYPLIQYYEHTMDKEFLSGEMYDYLRESVALYEKWLEKENGKYVLYAGFSEETWAKNPAVELAALKNTIRNLIKASEILDRDADKREFWKEMYAGLSAQPLTVVNGKKVLSLGEKQLRGSEWSELTNPIPADGNAIPLDAVIPGGVYNYFSSAEDLEIVHNTIDVFSKNGAWSQINNFPRLFPDAVKCRYPIELLVNHFAEVIEKQLAANLRIDDHCHGVEKCGSTETINSMLLISEDGIVKLFPNWYADKDAKFSTLRAKGAFLVSAEYNGRLKKAENVTVTSEKGSGMTMVVPWNEAKVLDSRGQEIAVTKGFVPNWPDEKLISFDTVAGETYYIKEV